MRTYNSSTGVINVKNSGPTSQLALRSYENDGSLTVQANSRLILGGENHYHIQNGTITGNGFLAFSLGNHAINTAFSSGSLAIIDCYGGYYFSGSGSITTTSSTTLYMYAGWTTIPITINGYSFFYYKPRTTNTITVNYILKWIDNCVDFGTNGKLNISANAELYLNSAGSTSFDVGATNFGITNCGTIICNADVNFTVPYTNCATSAINGKGAITSVSGHTVHFVRPGASPGTLTLNPSVTAASNAIFEMEIIGGFGAPGTADDADKLESVGNIDLNGTLKILLTNPAIGNYTIFNSTGGLVTGFGSLSVLYSVNGGAFTGTTPPNTTIQVTATSITIIITGAVLPAELLTFQGKNTEGGNLLTWQTASEINTDNFEIERSTDGQLFDKIGTVKAQGKAANYDFLDKTTSFITVYYRLKINDLDGKTDYSKIVTLSQKAKGLTAKAYPNPAHDILTVDIGVEKKSDVTIELKDILGRTIWQSKAENTEGSLSLPIPLTEVANGTYLLKVSNGLTTVQQKIVKNQ
jgi:hypothetical protein